MNRTSCRSALKRTGVRGEFALLERAGVAVIDFPGCRARTRLAHVSARPPLRFSADGRYLVYGDGAVIPTSGRGQVRHPLGKVVVWAWAPRGAELAAVSDRGAVEVWRPGTRPRRLLPDRWAAGGALDLAATGIAFSPDGRRLALARTTGPPGNVRARELWLVDLRTGAHRLLHRIGGVPSGVGDLLLAGFTPDGHNVVFWPDPSGSASIQSDGLPLAAVPVAGGRARTLVKVMLTYQDFVARCGARLVAAVGFGRETSYGKSLALLSPPAYRAVSLGLSIQQSWVDPSCSNRGAIAVDAGPASDRASFGPAHRSIWLIPAPGRRPVRLTNPRPVKISDELPRISASGHYILFVRTRTNKHGAQTGALELIVLGSGGRTRVMGPIAELGSTGIGYYGYYGWYGETAWHER